MTLEPIGRDVEDELRRLGPGGAIADVVAAWPEAVGPGIAVPAEPGESAVFELIGLVARMR